MAKIHYYWHPESDAIWFSENGPDIEATDPLVSEITKGEYDLLNMEISDDAN